MPITKPNETSTPVAASAAASVSARNVRTQASVLLSPKARAQVEQVVQEEDCSFGRAVETIIDRYSIYKQTVDDMRATVGSIKAGETRAVETVLFQQEWTPIRVMAGMPATAGWKLWAPPGTPFPIVEFERVT